MSPKTLDSAQDGRPWLEWEYWLRNDGLGMLIEDQAAGLRRSRRREDQA